MTSDRLQRFALIVWTTVGILVLAWAFLKIADAVRIIWLPVAFAAGIVFLLVPLVEAFTRIGMGRVAATFLAYLVSGAVIVGGGALIVPVISRQAVEFASSLPDLYDTSVAWLEGVAANLGVNLDEVWSTGAISEWLSDPANQETIQQVLASFGAGAGRVILGVTEAFTVLVLAPFLALYMLIDLDRWRARSLELTPGNHRDEVAYVGGELATALGNFVRGQLVVALFVAVMSSLGLFLIDLPFWLIIGIIAGITNLIPFAGPILGSALGIMVALLNGSFSQALWALAIFVVVQQIDNHVVTPLVQRTRVRLSPLVIVLALIVGGTLAGLLGVLIAIPVTAALRIVIGHLWRTRVLGQSWREATEGMIEVTPPPVIRLPGRHRADQSRLFDTQELQAWDQDTSERLTD